MWRFIKHYALEIYTVIAMMFIVFTSMLGELSTIQKLVVIDAFLFILHEWEESYYPGSFADIISSLIHIKVSDEKKRFSRVPAGILLLILSIVPFIYCNSPLIIMALATFGIIEGLVHAIGTRLFRTKYFYTPGMVTAIAETIVSILLICYLIHYNLGQWYDYVFGPIIMVIFFGMLQKTETKIVGIKYSDMPQYLKQQWQSPTK